MKVIAYIRVGVDREGANARARQPRIAVNVRPSDEPLRTASDKAIPTVAFAIELDLADSLFKRAETVIAEMVVPAKSARIAATVRQP